MGNDFPNYATRNATRFQVFLSAFLRFILSICAFGFSIFQFLIEGKRIKKESTIDAFEKIQSEIFDSIILSSKNIIALEEKKNHVIILANQKNGKK